MLAPYVRVIKATSIIILIIILTPSSPSFFYLCQVLFLPPFSPLLWLAEIQVSSGALLRTPALLTWPGRLMHTVCVCVHVFLCLYLFSSLGRDQRHQKVDWSESLMSFLKYSISLKFINWSELQQRKNRKWNQSEMVRHCVHNRKRSVLGKMKYIYLKIIQNDD